MTDLFSEIKIPIPKVKKHIVEIQGKLIEVSLQEKIDIIRNGEKNYRLEDGKPVKMELKMDRNRFPELEKLTGDPFWPEGEFIWKK